MASNSGEKFLRQLPCGINLYYRKQATNGSWRRISTDEDYLSKAVGDRIDEEAPLQIAKIESRTGQRPDSVVIEDGFHSSPGDVVSHAGVVYEDENGNHLSKKHIAEKSEEQAKSDSCTGK